MPFSREKTSFFYQKAEKRKEKTNPPNKKEISNKEGLGLSEVDLRATSPDP